MTPADPGPHPSAVILRRLSALIAVLALVLMSGFLPARPIAMPGGMQVPHDHVTDSALLTGQAVLVRPAAAASPPKAPDAAILPAEPRAPEAGGCTLAPDRGIRPPSRLTIADHLPGRPRAPPAPLA